MNDMSLKAKVRNVAKAKNISAQAVLQNYLMNRFLYRLSKSTYKDKFVIKGGMLISSIVGIAQRSTMDIDTTLRYLSLNENNIREAFDVIRQVPASDGIIFSFESIEPIRDDDEYGGYRMSFFAEFGKIKAPMSMDITTGDIITPGVSKHIFRDMFDETEQFELWSYPIETVLAEKTETILSRGVDNTRPRDFYDIFILSGCDYDKALFKEAFEATALYRDSRNKIAAVDEIIDTILDSSVLKSRWNGYARQMTYAAGISFEDTIEALKKLIE